MFNQFKKSVCRPCDHLVAVGKLNHAVWKQADFLRASHGKDGLPDWPEWCYLPIGGWLAIVSGGSSNVSLQMAGNVGRLAALGTWRATQGIYRFDPTIYQAIINTPMDGDVPHEVLYHLPEWCIYVETHGMEWEGEALYGFFAHMECDANNGRPELRLLLDAAKGLIPIPLHLGPWTLNESITRMVNESNIHAKGVGVVARLPCSVVNNLRPVVEPLVSLLLYLCSQNAEIGDGKLVPTNPRAKRTKNGWRLFPPDKPTAWDVGVRVGSALRRANHTEGAGQGDSHTGPRPHIRRAHWHGFRSGAMKRADGSEIPVAERKFALRWLPPIPVNVEDLADLPATIRPVKGE